MKIAFILFDGMTLLDFVGVYDPVTRLKTTCFLPDLEWDLCAFTPQAGDIHGLQLMPTKLGEPLSGYDLVIVPGGPGTRSLATDDGFLDWLKTAEGSGAIASVCTGSLLLGAAGFLKNRRATTHPAALDELRKYGADVVEERIVDQGKIITSAGVTAAIDLGLYLCERYAGAEAAEKIRTQMDYSEHHQLADRKLQTAGSSPADLERMMMAVDQKASSAGQPLSIGTPGSRRAVVERKTNETQINVELNLDGRGRYKIDTGIGFLDHMLTHLSVHGLFDLELKAQGDLHIDPHHTVEDVALALGGAFAQALGERVGIVRMASAYAPMDETLAFVAVDLSGRPYASVEAEWTGWEVGGIPVSLIPHFIESFSTAARCNLHARILSGRDDHHKAEATFKALARALEAASRTDPRRSGRIPSTKGTLTA